MGLVTGLLGLPLVPLRGVLWLAEQVLEQAEDQFYDPARGWAASKALRRRAASTLV